MKTGNTDASVTFGVDGDMPQWSPVMKTGNTSRRGLARHPLPTASMEPGHEDREYSHHQQVDHREHGASMEPGHEDREYEQRTGGDGTECGASMEPGHEDREYG